jgi:hypothetical protein
MYKLISLLIIGVVILAGIDYVVTNGMSQTSLITISNKYTDGELYIVKTISVEEFATTSDIYNKLEVGKTYRVKILNGVIKEATNAY